MLNTEWRKDGGVCDNSGDFLNIPDYILTASRTTQITHKV